MIMELLDDELAGEADWGRSLWLRLHRQQARRAHQEEFGRAVAADAVEPTAARLFTLPRDFRSTEAMALLALDCMADLPATALKLADEARLRLDTRPSRDVTNIVWDIAAHLRVRGGEPDRGVATASRVPVLGGR